MNRFPLIIVMLTLFACKKDKLQFAGSDIYSFNEKPRIHFKLTEELNEISGLAVDKNDRVFVHNDELGIVYQLDPESAAIIKSFRIGRDLINADFEGIAIIDSLFYMVSSDGIIYEFPEGEDNTFVKFNTYRTDLKTDFNIEGLCYDPKRNSLLLAAKGTSKKFKDNRVIWEFSLAKKMRLEEPRFLLNVNQITAINSGDKQFGPSGIEINPLTGNLFIIAYRGLLILSLNESGDILTVDKLANHKQPEGISFLSNGDCLIADERNERSARLSIYAYGKQQ
ncbi:MAG: SdiA-regulated domain-containing protein [Calditrichaeota bacterium]|nr:SdiA-regulated domain-containing protein [Calditrichota bacterium]